MKLPAALAEILKREGVEFVIGYPVHPVLAAGADADIRPIIVRQERTGIHMADAFSRINSGDRIGVFANQYGPGTENAFGGVAQAYSESVPIVVLPGGYPRTETNVAPRFSALVSFQHITKWMEQVTVARALPDAMRRAFTQARNGRGGPCVVEIPTDLFPEEVPDDFDYTPTFKTLIAPDLAAVAEAARVLVAAEHPLIYAGQGVHYAKGWEALKELAEALEAPVTTSLEGKSAFPEDHPLSLGSGGRSMPAPVHEFLQQADVVLGIGCSFTRTGYGISFPRGKTYIQSTIDTADLNKDLPVQHAVIGDARLVLEALTAAVRGLTGGQSRGRRAGIVDRIAQSRAAWLERWLPKLTSNDTPLSPYRVIWDLLDTVDVGNTIITHDAGSPRDQISPFWQTTTPLSYIGWGKSTQLGYGLGLAMGAKLARPEKLCINVWGDAAIGMTGMDFETAVRERIPILSILFNNFSMAIELAVMQKATEKYRSTDISGNYADFAKALGGFGERVTQPDQIKAAIKRGIAATEAGQPALLEFITQKETEISVFR